MNMFEVIENKIEKGEHFQQAKEQTQQLLARKIISKSK
jgi:hypothetical protein